MLIVWIKKIIIDCDVSVFCQNVYEKLVNTEERKVEESKLLVLNLVNYLGNIELYEQHRKTFMLAFHGYCYHLLWVKSWIK